MIELWYETHSFSIDNERGIATGWLPGALSERGLASAAELGQRLRERRVEAIFASDLHRAVQTAEIARRHYAAALILDPRLRECSYGDLNGHDVGEIESLRLASIERPFPNGESFADVVKRTRAFLLSLGLEWDGTTIQLVSHSANRWALDLLFNHRSLAGSMTSPFNWQPGWKYELSGGWRERLKDPSGG